MIKLIVTLIGAFLIIFLILNLLTNLSKQDKLKVLYLFISITIIAGVYEFFQDKRSDKNREVILKFMHGESIYCKDIEVNKSEFNFVSGTLIFVGKKNTNENIILKVEECK